MGRSRVSNSEGNVSIWTKIKIIQDIIFVLVACMYDEDPIKNEVAIHWTR